MRALIIRPLIFILLTALTQIGGIIYVVSLLLASRLNITVKYKKIAVFIGLYLLATFIIVPIVAPIFGREKIQNTQIIRPTNYLTVVLNRNYVRPKVNQVLSMAEQELQETDIKINYLDANFPFINKFPLLPHLSHNDGKKIDFSLVYETASGDISSKQKSMSGYGVFVEPTENESNQPQKCLNQGYYQYDYPKYLTFGSVNDKLVFSNKGTKKLLQALLQSPNVSKIFIEPHLKTRINLTNNKLRYHGCYSVRHDDHIHLQIK